VKWVTPAPWKTVDCEIDLRHGGIFRAVMRSPEGQDMDSSGRGKAISLSRGRRRCDETM
jgi:uncharacterized protein YndB with AHSA1/START domain